MLKRLIGVCLVLAIATPALAQEFVYHNNGKVTGWRGGNNHSPNYCWLASWPDLGWGAHQDATLAEFNRTDLQVAINRIIDSAGGWNAEIMVTQPDWANNNNDPMLTHPNLQPVVGSFTVDAAAIDWVGISANSFTAGLGAWALGGTTHATFGAATLAGVPTGKSAVYDTIPWVTERRDPLWDVVFDVPDKLIVQYMRNPSVTGLFASAKTPIETSLSIYQNQNLGSDIRVRINVPPFGKPWMNATIGTDQYALWAERTIVQGGAAQVIPVRIDNIRSGTLVWAAVESPDAPWLTLANASGGNGGTFNMTLDATGLAAGEYNTTVVITDGGTINPARNSPLTIPVRLTVQANAPVIQLVPSSLSFQASASGANPAAQTVTVNNIGSGTLNWTAAENPDVSWMSISPTTGTSASGATGSTFTVSINKTGLAIGTHTGTIRVTDPAAANSPQDLAVTVEIRDQDASIPTANSYDDTWQTGATGWIATMRNVRAARPAGVPATSGFCVFLGDSITYSNASSAWARYGSGKNAEDTAICNWFHAGATGSGGNTTNDGTWLARADVSGRNGSYTARSGITTAGYLAGYTAPDLPSMDKMFTAGFTNPDGKQYRDAEIAVILLGTNDLPGTPAATVAANLSTMVDKLQANGIIPVLTTVPPKSGADVVPYVTAVKNLAQTRKLPVIDLYQEMVRRRPDNSVFATLIGDGVHPSGDRAGFTVSNDPYANNGAALSEVGYLLRSWLTVQKINEVKKAVIDAWPLAADITFDRTVGVADLQALVMAWASQKTPASGNWNANADINKNGYVNVGDLQALIAQWGQTAP